MRVIEYLKALQPRRVIWSIGFAVLGISLFGVFSYIASRIIGGSPVADTTIGVSIALLITLFVSGFIAWDKERAKNEDKWPRLSTDQRIVIANALRPLPLTPEISILVNDEEDSTAFAVDLSDILERATNSPSSFAPQIFPFPIASGLRIDASTDDARAPLIKKILKNKTGIEAHIERRSQVGFAIFIGRRA
jgi:hypothetical protein